MRNNKGVTLVEVLIAMVVLLFVSLAMMQTALVSIDSNLKNALRDEAVMIAEMRMNQTRAIPFDSIVTDAGALPVGVDCPTTFALGTRVPRSLRNINKDFCTNLTVPTPPPSTDSRLLQMRVTWNWKGEAYIHSITTLLRRQ